MTGVEHATIGVLVMLVFLIGPVLIYIKRARRNADLYVRRLPGVDAVDEAVGRAAELGRPIVFSTGITGLNAILYACLGVLSYIGRKAVRYRTRLLLPQNDPSVMAVAGDVLKDAYRSEGRLSAFDPNSIVYLSDEQFAFAAGYMGLVQRERAATTFLFGSFAAEALILAQAGQEVGAMQVAASVNPEQVAFFICTCDYTLIGEELFGASAYMSREPVLLGSLYGQDRAKLFFFVLIVLGVLAATWNALAALGGLNWVLPDLIDLIKRAYW